MWQVCFKGTCNTGDSSSYTTTQICGLLNEALNIAYGCLCHEIVLDVHTEMKRSKVLDSLSFQYGFHIDIIVFRRMSLRGVQYVLGTPGLSGSGWSLNPPRNNLGYIPGLCKNFGLIRNNFWMNRINRNTSNKENF